MNKFAISVCFGLLAYGCSTNVPEVRHRTWQRIDKKNLTTSSGMPNFYFGDFPKNTSFKEKERKIQSQNNLENSPARKIYFIGLYRQYKELERMLELSPSKAQCPAYHHEVVTWGRDIERSLASAPEHLSYNYEKIVLTDNNVSAFPELALPLSEKGRVVLDLLEENPKEANRYLKQGLQEHFDRTQEEIVDLCQSGISNNFYIYENFIRHIQAHPDFWKNKDNLASAFKIPVVGNYYLIHSMSHFPVNQYEREILRRVGLEWLPSNLSELKKKRDVVGMKTSGSSNGATSE